MYDKFKKTLTVEEYFSTWDPKELKMMHEDSEAMIYNKYFVKATVFQRDKLKCQNSECKGLTHKLEMHHVKFQKNGGKTTVRNCVTLCGVCAKMFHHAKGRLLYYDYACLPAHIRGKPYTLDEPEEDTIDWKAAKKEMRAVRKRFKELHGLAIDWKYLVTLLKWLEQEYTEMNNE